LGRFEFLLGAPESSDPLPPLLEDAVWLLMIVLKDASKQANTCSFCLSFLKHQNNRRKKNLNREREKVQKERNGGKDCVIKERDGLFKG
jgi:adenine-specific DNA methylase